MFQLKYALKCISLFDNHCFLTKLSAFKNLDKCENKFDCCQTQLVSHV